MKKILPILLAFVFAAMLSGATITPEFNDDLGTITTAWRITYAYGEGAQSFSAVFALAEKAVWGNGPLPATGFNLHLVELLNGTDGFKGCSLAYVDDGTGNAYEWRFRVRLTNDASAPKTEQVAVTLEPVIGFEGGIPSGGQLDILNENGSLFQAVDDPAVSNEVTLTSNKTYILRFTVAKRYGEAGCTLTLRPGWNLVGIPLQTLDNAGTLLNHLVVDPANGNVRVTAAAQLSGGRAYWVYNATGAEAEVTLHGQAPLVTPSHLPDLNAAWNFVSPIAQYDEEHDTFSLCNVSGFRWDTDIQAFQPVEGAATLGQGYAVPK